MKGCVALLLMGAVLSPVAQFGKGSMRIGTIEFFGTAGIDIAAVRALLPVHEGDPITESEFPRLQADLAAALERAAAGRLADLFPTCCDANGNWMLYIGLSGKNSRAVPHLPPPAGTACLPPSAVALYDQAMEALLDAVGAGDASEDDSRGYALSKNAKLRGKQLAMREYAVGHPEEVKAALDCARVEDRRAAA